jgi:hypothetical protein
MGGRIKEIRMEFRPFAMKELEFLKELVGEERVSTGSSYLELHAVDEANNKAPLPDAVVWPKSTEESAQS